ncbi:MAG: RnfABCDGE type electron transport complex subunit G [Eubacteriales bacterium]|nr:RnfABCDGE type electron transport complex subunit G [Eubacteriales bacterium]
MKSMLKDAAILFAITLIAGLLLGGVYQITKEPIAVQEALKLENACREVFADAASFEEAGDFDAVHAEEVLAAGGYTAQTIGGCQTAFDSSGQIIGYVITVTSHEGYGGDIQFTMGINSDGSLNGISLLSISETPGLGMQAEDVLVPQFAGRSSDSFVYTKTGASAENEIDAISGATITTNAVTNGVNAGLYYFQSELQSMTGGAGNE